ncbi:MAG: hypothetical protein IPK93_10310 [Solirubrobacterales bacterium]|nr:hypothetical protein [Solirubrobacterales bacterium]
MSDYVVHLTKDEPGGASGYNSWIGILGDGELRAGPLPFGAAKNIPELTELNRCVCFSEIPLDMLDRLVSRRSEYGIGFHKDFIVQQGGAPLWYLDRAGPRAQHIGDEIKRRIDEGIDVDDPFWKITPFVDRPGFYGTSSYRFEWEREWRLVGDLAFGPSNVAFLFLPEAEHEKARQFFVDVEIAHTGPHYLVPYIDASWDMSKIQDALENLPEPPEPSPGVTPWFL